jgi:membrane-bound lytic murein transglycosylase MltF
MIERRVVRVLTVQSPVLYFVDRGREVGVVYEQARPSRSSSTRRPGPGS